MAASPQEAAHVPQLVEDARTTSWTNVSALSILMFDYVATFDDEVTLFWGAPWTISKFLYLLNRYFTILLIIFNTCAQTWHITSASTCSKLLQVQCFGAAVTIATVDAILMLRVWILYEKSRKVLWFLSSTFSAELIAMLILSFYYEEPKFVQVKFVPEGCYSAVDQRHFTIFVIGPLIVSLMMFTMTLHCCLTTLHASRGVGMPLFELFLRDGVLYFLAASPVLISGLLIWHFARPALSNLIEGYVH
ncbi:hypothetical protein OBBRIDRAFT_798840 [Obba rivulosa]|uniref:DUF6533 domain-containing protein n=1 Tax=Obba rivulosa TaxID=1052685 RepID=A0A8E2DEE3_9APHY|nr:hypothetical protein OBBRIDRAFT_798840 [Obba rivulosa]